MADRKRRMTREEEEALARIKRLDAFLAVSFVINHPELHSRAAKLEEPGAELEDAYKYLAESALATLRSGGKSPKMRAVVKAGLMARIAEWFGSDDGILRILDSEEAQTIAHLMGPEVE